ncbi:Efflux pump FUS6 [Colletotrichum sp. SAR11_57]|nr:Efflux pump FUS6 [Colletotrichum sp. SAR11_57]
MAQFTDPGTSPVTPHEPLQTLTAPQTSTDPQVIENDHADPAAPWKTQGWRFWAVFPGLRLAMLLTGLDASILATSLPTIVSDLHGGALYIWTMNGYFLTTAVVQPLMGQAADIFGMRIPMLVALSFTLGSFLGPIIGGAIVDNPTWLYFQILLESTPLQSGVKLLAVVVPLAPAGMAGGIAIAVTGHYKMFIVAGFVLLSIAVGCMTTLDANSSTAVWIVFQVLAGLGGGLSLTATLPAVQAPVPESDVAIATAAWAFARSFGAIWGAAIPSAVFNSRFDELLHLIPEPSVREILAHGGAYEHAIRLFIKQFDAQPVLKEQIIYEVELRQELKTNFGLKETPQAQG